MKMIEIESVWEAIPGDVANQPGRASPPGHSDLESYLDFLDEIEAFDGPKGKPIDYPTEFEL
ncbi:MAG: hypothetical protein ISS62_00990 [Desulfobacteraceae bacterium]|nr:hypothetical protein [Desulfobacteraceae bacterium]